MMCDMCCTTSIQVKHYKSKCETLRQEAAAVGRPATAAGLRAQEAAHTQSLLDEVSCPSPIVFLCVCVCIVLVHHLSQTPVHVCVFIHMRSVLCMDVV